jgi:hypothetical protein
MQTSPRKHLVGHKGIHFGTFIPNKILTYSLAFWGTRGIPFGSRKLIVQK